MDFEVYTDATSHRTYGGEARYLLKDGGILEVSTADKRITYGPHGWQRIEEPRPDDREP